MPERNNKIVVISITHCKNWYQSAVTKLQSKLARGYSNQHSYKALVQEFCGISISKAKQSSDFGKKDLDADQLKYSSNDVLHITKINDELNKILIREKRIELYKESLKYLKVRVELDLAGYENTDVWSHEWIKMITKIQLKTLLIYKY